MSMFLAMVKEVANLGLFIDISGYDCGGTGVLSVIKFVWQLLDIVLFLVPIGLILMVSLDLSKNVISGKDDDMKKNLKLCIKRLIMCVVMFLVEPIVIFSIGLLDDVGINYASCVEIALNDDISQYKIEVEEDDYSNVTTPNFDRNPVYASKGKIDLTDEDYKHLNTYNQTGQYAGNSACGSTTVAASACGMSSYMASRYVLTKKDTNYMAFINEACQTGFHNGKGGSWQFVENKGNIYEGKYGIKSENMEESYDAILKAINSGSVVVALIHSGRRTIEDGGFNGTSNQHFIVLVNYDSSKDQIYVYNPTGENTGWTKKENVKNYIVNKAVFFKKMSVVS